MIKMYLYTKNEIPKYSGLELQPEQKERETDLDEITTHPHMQMVTSRTRPLDEVYLSSS